MIQNILAKTNEGGESNKKVGILYDIGCNIEKGIIRVCFDCKTWMFTIWPCSWALTFPLFAIKRNLFPEQMEGNQLKFGTSVFHAYVHQWSCQLQYNPRLNPGWGMSDGEGMERIWAFLSPLVRQLRYTTKNHRLLAIDIRASHHNDVGRMYAGIDFKSFDKLAFQFQLMIID